MDAPQISRLRRWAAQNFKTKLTSHGLDAGEDAREHTHARQGDEDLLGSRQGRQHAHHGGHGVKLLLATARGPDQRRLRARSDGEEPLIIISK